MTHGVQSLLRIGRNTADLGRAVAFYRDALGFHVDEANTVPPAWTRLPGACEPPSRCALLSLGAQQVELTEFRDAAPYPADSSSCDLWFQHCAIVVSGMEAAYERVMQGDAVPITRGGPQLLPPSAGSVTAFKFRDPDGHPLELISFPPGTGDPRWQSAHKDGSTLGIDHSAISVAETARSVPFYELLGFSVSSRGLNRGIAQQHLDDLADVEVGVIALRPQVAATPHLELLCYHPPRGRAITAHPVTAIAADRLIWQVGALDVLLDAVTDAGFPDAVITGGRIDGSGLALLRDPDGHRLVLRQIET